MSSSNSRTGRAMSSLWGSTVSAWAGLGRWQRVGALVGLALLLATAGITVDSQLFRQEDYRQWRMEHQNEQYASQIVGLLKPVYDEQQRRQQVQQQQQLEAKANSVKR